MSGNKLFLDTNILLYFLKGDPEVIEVVSDKDAVVSFVTELELLSYPDLTLEQETNIRGLLKNCQLINLNQEIKELSIELKRKYKIKLPDALIAGTAYYFNTPLFTADRQFRQIDELEVLIYEL